MGTDLPPGTAEIEKVRKVYLPVPFTDKQIEMYCGVAFDLRAEQSRTIQSHMDTVKFKFHPRLTPTSKRHWENMLLKPPINAQVLIRTEPKGFCIVESKNRSLEVQEALLLQHEAKMREETGLGADVLEIIPEQTSTFVTMMLKHYEETGIWLLGPRYGREVGLFGFSIYARTKDPVYESTGKYFAYVGINDPGIGIEIGNLDEGPNSSRNISEDRNIFVVPLAVRVEEIKVGLNESLPPGAIVRYVPISRV